MSDIKPGEVHISETEEWEPSDDQDDLTEDTMAVQLGPDTEGRLIAIILLVAMVVFATYGDHKDKAFKAMAGQLESWTGLDFSEEKWGLGDD
jgi:hypothetical protein